MNCEIAFVWYNSHVRTCIICNLDCTHYFWSMFETSWAFREKQHTIYACINQRSIFLKYSYMYIVYCKNEYAFLFKNVELPGQQSDDQKRVLMRTTISSLICIHYQLKLVFRVCGGGKRFCTTLQCNKNNLVQ
jgi:hypothetical protein